MTLTKRQRTILDFIRTFSDQRGYAPTLAEIGRRVGLRSPATVHKHLCNLEARGVIRRSENQSRGIEVLPEEGTARAFELPLAGRVSGSRPLVLEPPEHNVPVPAGLVGEHRTFALQVVGDAFHHVLIGDGDLIVIEDTDPEEGALVLVTDGNRPLIQKHKKRNTELRLRGRVLGVLRKYPVS